MSIVPNNNTSSSPFPISVRLLTIILSIGVAFGSGLGYGFSQANSTQNQQELPAQTQHLGQVEYERLELGMSLAEVESILDRGTEVSRSESTMVFVWENPDRSRITVTFKHGKLNSKEQFGLR